MSKTQFARYNIGQVIRHRLYDLRGVIFDVDASPAGANAGPAAPVAQDKTQDKIQDKIQDKTPGLVYRLLAEDENIPYVACIAEHDLLPDLSGEPVSHPEINALFEMDGAGSYRRRKRSMN